MLFSELTPEEQAASPSERERWLHSLAPYCLGVPGVPAPPRRPDYAAAVRACYAERPLPAEMNLLASWLEDEPLAPGTPPGGPRDMPTVPPGEPEPELFSAPPMAPLGENDVALAEEVEKALAARPVPYELSDRLEDYLALATLRPFAQRYAAACELRAIKAGYPLRDGRLPVPALLPVLLQKEFHYESDPNALADSSLFYELDASWLVRVARSILMVSPPVIQSEFKLLDLVSGRAYNDAPEQEILALVLAEGQNAGARREARDKLGASAVRSVRLRRLAAAFAWGTRLCRALTGRPYQLEMISNERLGYTRFNEEKLYISPMPILREEPYGDSIVRGLILHELGHHLYHKSPEALAIWEAADKTGMGELLNLVSDEHLERNLRTINPRYGHYLRRLNAYAFQQRQREIGVDTLLEHFGGHAFPILSSLRLRVARDPVCVVVQNGRLLRLMEAQGMSFARFMRALRMGLGDRYGDPKVAEALALFRGRFRHLDMSGLMAIAQRLKEIFGDETKLLNWMNQDESLRSSDDVDLPTRDELKNAMGQVMGGEGKQNDQHPRPRGRATGGMNLDPNVQFRTIDKIVRLKHDPMEHAKYARQVAREAQILRQCLHGLGLGFVPETMRTQGRRLDRGRTRDLLLRSDPRVLIARRMQRLTDLFLGVAIDCSSSMGGQRIEKAKLFGTLLAEAVRNQRGIDLRLFGFTEREIFDAGTARACAVHALQANGGNNDAAGLQHVYEVAQASQRKAKLLIMISDGLPSDCSVAALSHLVQRLTRRRYCCAQVAVAPLSQMCFPHYILLDDQNLADSTRKFGVVVRKLVQQALGA